MAHVHHRRGPRRSNLSAVIAPEHPTETFVQLGFDGIVRWISPRVEMLLGYDATAMTGANLVTFVHPSDREHFVHTLTGLRAGCDEVRITFRAVHANSRDITIASTFRLVRNAVTGTPREAIAVLRDASRLIADGQDLASSAADAQSLVDSVVDYAIYTLDLDGIIRSWNAGAQRITGFAPDEIIGKHFSVFFTVEDIRRDEPAHSLEVARTRGTFVDEGWRVRKDGSRLWANVAIDVVRNYASEVVGFVKITRDVTEMRALVEHLQNERDRLTDTMKVWSAAKIIADDAVVLAIQAKPPRR